MSMFESSEIAKLAELFKSQTNSNSEDEEDEIERPTVKDLGPHDLNGKICATDGNKNNKNDKILDPEEEALRYLDGENFETSDWRKTPEWDIAYRQQVTPSDLFLGMGGKTAATSSCENMVIDVHLPGEKKQNVDLKVTCERLQLLSPRFRLNIPLPHPVDPQKGNAQFDQTAEKLIITLQLNREFDYINF